jgi:multiple sugar transport system permease protein
MIFFLAGLQDIPRTLYESAAIDGAGRWQAFWRITLPLLRRTTTFVLVADTAANFLLFVPVYVLTQGGPTGSTDLLMYEVYRAGFIASDMGRAAALTVILLLATLVVVFLELMLGGSTVSE